MPAKPKPKKKKPKTIATLVEEAAVILQRIVRKKAADENGYVSCVTCGVTRQWDDGMQGGHFISRNYTAHKLLEENINVQCKNCNGPQRSNPILYTLYMQDTYGRDFVDKLIATKRETKKYRRHEILDYIEELKEYERRITGEM